MNDDLTTVERSGKTRRIVQAKVASYETPELRDQYAQLTEQAQNYFLDKDFKAAKHHAMLAMRIRPTSHLFGLCASIADAVGNFNEAADFRLLQAFQADDVELWKELLNEFLENSLWFKATVCLKRLSAMAPPHSRQRHDIQLQLADLFVALGEHSRATTIYRNLWVKSEMKDFEVFATLSSLLFQLGRWNALDNLLKESTVVFLKNEVAKTVTITGDDDDESTRTQKVGKKRGRQVDGKGPQLSSSVINALLKGSGATAAEAKSSQAKGGSEQASTKPAPATRGPRVEPANLDGRGADGNEDDDFGGFDDVFEGGGGSMLPTSYDNDDTRNAFGEETDDFFSPQQPEPVESQADPFASTMFGSNETNDNDFDFGGGTGGDTSTIKATPKITYNPFIELSSPEEIRNYLSLINVHTELLNERGQFSDTIQLVLLAASHLRINVLEMNADILLKLAIAHAYKSNLGEAEGIVKKLMETCSPAQFGDVLFDAAETLAKIGAFTLASTVFKYLLRFSRLEDDNANADHLINSAQTVGLSPRYALRPKETIEALRDRIDRDVALLFGIAKCAANDTPFGSYITGSTPILLSPTSASPIFSASPFPNDKSRQHPAMAALLEIHEQLDPFHAPTRLLLSQLYHHEFGYYEAAERVLLPPKPLLSAEALSAAAVGGGVGGSSLFVDPLAPKTPQSLSALSATMAQFALSNDPSLLRESGMQRTQCDSDLILLYSIMGPARAMDLLKCGVPFFDRILSSADGDDEDSESVIAGGKKSRAPSLALPRLSSASSAIVPASRVAGSLAGDGGPATSTLLSTTRSIATSARSSTAGGRLLLSKRGASAGSSHITSSATTALTVAGSKVGPASTVAGMLEAKDSTGIFRFNKTRKPAGGGSGGDVAAIGKRIRKTVGRMDISLEGNKDGGDAAAAADDIAGTLSKAAASASWKSTKTQHQKSRKDKQKASGSADIKTRSEILELQAPGNQRKWEVSSVGNLGDIALMEEVMGMEGEDGSQNAPPSDVDGRDDEGFLLPSSPSGATASKSKGAEGGEEDGALPSIEDVIASNFSGDPQMAALFRNITEGGPSAPIPEAGEGGAAAANSSKPEAQPSPVTAALPIAMASAATTHDKRPPAADCFRIFGLSKIVRLALAMMDAYSDLEEHGEGKDFGVYFLFKLNGMYRRSEHLRVPVRLAVLRQSLLSGDASNAVRSTVSILQNEGKNEDPSKSLFGENSDANTTTVAPPATSQQRHLWETFSVLVNGGLKTPILNRLISDKGRKDFELLCIVGNQYYNYGSYAQALRYYLVALSQRPRDPLLLLMIGLSYLHGASRRTAATNNPIQLCFYYLQEYYVVVTAETPSCIPEALFNIARAYHFLSLYYLAEPMYRRAINLLEQEGVGLPGRAQLVGPGKGEESPFGPNAGSGGIQSATADRNSSFYGFSSVADDTPVIDQSIRRGFGFEGALGNGAAADMLQARKTARQHWERQEMLLQAARYNLACIYKKSKNAELALKTLMVVTH